MGERGLVWGDARGLHGSQLAEEMLRVASDYGFDDAHAGVAMTPVAAEVAATQSDNAARGREAGAGSGRSSRRTSSRCCRRPSISRRCSRDSASRPAARSPRSTPRRSRCGSASTACGSGSARAPTIERWLFRVPLRALPSASIEWVEYGLKDPERLLFVINSLAGTVCTSLVERGERAREMALVFSLGNRTQRTHIIRSSRPSSEQKRWMRLVREALDTLTLPDAVMGVTLRVESVTGNHGAQGDLFDRGFASAPMVEDAIIQLTDDQGDVVVEPDNSEHPLVEDADDVEESRRAIAFVACTRIDAIARAHAAAAAVAQGGDGLHRAAARSRRAGALSRRQRVARHRRSGGAGSRVGRTMADAVRARVFPLRA